MRRIIGSLDIDGCRVAHVLRHVIDGFSRNFLQVDPGVHVVMNALARIQKKEGTTKLSEFVFHRDGERVVDFRKPWKEASKKAHVQGRLFHDLRRTAVRNMIRAGAGQAVAMSISGHKTVSMFIRYNITSASDKHDALRKTAQHLAAQPTKQEDAKVVELQAREAASR